MFHIMYGLYTDYKTLMCIRIFDCMESANRQSLMCRQLLGWFRCDKIKLVLLLQAILV